jgi:hypothetical protein
MKSALTLILSLVVVAVAYILLTQWDKISGLFTPKTGDLPKPTSNTSSTSYYTILPSTALGNLLRPFAEVYNAILPSMTQSVLNIENTLAVITPPNAVTGNTVRVAGAQGTWGRGG